MERMAATLEVWNIQMLQLFKRVRMEATVWNFQVLQLIKENVNGEGSDGETSSAACFYGNDVACSICAESKSEQVGVAKGENEEAEGGMAPEAKGGKCPSSSSGQNSKADNSQSAPSAAPASLKKMTA